MNYILFIGLVVILVLTLIFVLRRKSTPDKKLNGPNIKMVIGNPYTLEVNLKGVWLDGQGRRYLVMRSKTSCILIEI